MAKPGQSSFRRILLSRLLLLSVPVLLAGVFVTYRKTRSALLDTARHKITESAVIKGKDLQKEIALLQVNLMNASNSVALQSNSPEVEQRFIDYLAQQLPTQIQCVQLRYLLPTPEEEEAPALEQNSTAPPLAAPISTCPNQWLHRVPANFWPKQQTQLSLDASQIYVTVPIFEEAKTAAFGGRSPLYNPPEEEKRGLIIKGGSAKQNNPTNQLQLLLSAPVYNSDGQLQSVLTIQARLLQQEPSQRTNISGYTVVIDQEGIILSHPDSSQLGKFFGQEADGKQQISNLLNRAIASSPGSENLFFWQEKRAQSISRWFRDDLTKVIDGRLNPQEIFSGNTRKVELLAGYTAVDSPLTSRLEQKWIILAVTPLDRALVGLQGIKEILLYLTCGLIIANFLVILYVARDLARPVEKLRDYALNEALNESQLHPTDKIPQNFKIREFNQLSEALDGMIQRMRDWAEELETAWKEAQTANQLKNEFLANTSHELRTPLNGIIGCLRLVKDGFCDDREEEQDFLQRADDAAIHLLGIINDVLDLAKIEAGKLSVEMEPVNLRKLLNEVINLQALAIQQQGLEFNTSDLHEEIPVRADPAKFKQVLLNVVGNAVKFTDSGSITIKTRMEPAKGHTAKDVAPDKAADLKLQTNSLLTNEFVIVTVKDTGIGIDLEQQQKLFRPFVMVDGSSTRKRGGTGLGLAISRSLIEMMGGNITLSSEGQGKGTTIEISLPLDLNSKDTMK
ncbi:MAG: two-component sensor histidine kinase [Symploca sp. SIO3E6]|nr:two-component sensor histidine kinase [Caldora sp. SIO3E6]